MVDVEAQKPYGLSDPQPPIFGQYGQDDPQLSPVVVNDGSQRNANEGVPVPRSAMPGTGLGQTDNAPPNPNNNNNTNGRGLTRTISRVNSRQAVEAMKAEGVAGSMNKLKAYSGGTGAALCSCVGIIVYGIVEAVAWSRYRDSLCPGPDMVPTWLIVDFIVCFAQVPIALLQAKLVQGADPEKPLEIPKSVRVIGCLRSCIAMFTTAWFIFGCTLAYNSSNLDCKSLGDDLATWMFWIITSRFIVVGAICCCMMPIMCCLMACLAAGAAASPEDQA